MLDYIEKKSVASLYLPFVALQQLCEVATVCCPGVHALACCLFRNSLNNVCIHAVHYSL